MYTEKERETLLVKLELLGKMRKLHEWADFGWRRLKTSKELRCR